MKICFVCGAKRPLTEFYKHKKMADGHLNKCIDCVKSYERERRMKNAELIRAYDRKRHWENPERRSYSNAQSKSWASKNKEKVREKQAEWRKRNPEKRKAHQIVGNAVRDGKLKRGYCEVCGDINAHAHHDDYSKPLDVRWLCPEHHALEHMQIRSFSTK